MSKSHFHILNSLCCAKGKIQLPRPPQTPEFLLKLYNDKAKGSAFMRIIRLYNTFFALSSSGGNVDHSINNGGTPYVYHLNGQNHHVFGQLIPDEGQDPKFCQLYIYGTENEVGNRIRWIKDGHHIDTEVVQGLITLLDETNQLVRCFRTARDRFKEDDIIDMKIVLKVCRSESGRGNHIGPSDEVAAVMVGDLDDTCGERDIIIECKQHGLKCISKIHPSLVALQYPILFPNGEDGFHDDIKFVESEHATTIQRDKVSMMEYYAYKLQVRPGQDAKSKTYLQNNMDKYVSAEIPDPTKDPDGYAAVKQFMIHGPCGREFSKAPCMKDFKCIRHFPKKYCDGNVPTLSDGLQDYLEDDIRIPSQFYISEGSNTIVTMVSSTFPDLLQNFSSPNYLSKRAILTPTNQTVGHLNSVIVNKIPSEAVSYFNLDEADDFGEMSNGVVVTSHLTAVKLESRLDIEGPW
ncbi:hypothetical protein POM88_002219 [Heracleum sosnowskyi]|uniref:ATP-dependent DNA helicase n=1 Tax=Heracleum sosnowskyi TaxID=360622 RepID=A0AAD8JFQ1_9APIA|nr:hypothetical protein POM88_002219 [Heracleum sosnowskyi]